MGIRNTETKNKNISRGKDYLQNKLLLFGESEKIKSFVNSYDDFNVVRENNGVCIRWVSLEGIILAVNESCCKLYEMESEEIIGRPFHSIMDRVNNGDLNDLITLFNRNLLKANIDYYFKKFNVTNKGKSLFIEGINTFIEIADINGNKPGTFLLTIFKSVEENKAQKTEDSFLSDNPIRSEETETTDLILRNNEEMYRTLFETSPDAIFLLDINGNILMSNKRAATILGYMNVEEIHQMNVFSFVAPGDAKRLFRDSQRLILSGLIENVEYSAITKHGEVLPVEINASLVFDLVGKPEKIVTIMRDISKRKKAEEELRSAEKFAAIGRQSAILAHEIKTPLASIKMNIDMLFNNLTLTGNKQKSFRIIQKETQRLVKLLKNILLFSRELNFVFLTVDLGDLIDNIENLMRPVLDEHSITLKNNLKDFKIKGDYRNLQTLFLHLLENSVEAMPDGGEIELYSTINNHGSCSVFLKDTGCGIPDDIKIFDPFFTTKSSGTGLGLAIVKNIIKQHNGDIKLVNSVKGNTTFEIIFNNKI
jgi:PAS domain S-box-containing protein